ncbi:MAG: branched-chain amino acid ABC transporter permease [Chloroflexi bacterium]|nr:branched-chain amino acid ABC transporter permease [Chloroflexota bacterium]
MVEILKKNRTRLITLAVLAFLFVTAIQGMETKDWAITVLRGLSVGAITFLVASGFSLILGLMNILNLAHGEMFMIGAYVGWTVYVRPDTFVDIIPPLAFLAVGLVLTPLWRVLLGRLKVSSPMARIWPWAGLVLALLILAGTFVKFPISIWNAEEYAESPTTYALNMSQGVGVLPEAAVFESLSPMAAIVGTLVGGIVLAVSLAGLGKREQMAGDFINNGPIIGAVIILLVGLAVFWGNDALTNALYNMNTTVRFFLAMLVAMLGGGVLGMLIETTLIRPLYERHTYQILMTLGLSFIGIEIVRVIWGRPEFTMPKPELFAANGGDCPAASIGGWLANNCSTIFLLDGRVRTYNEIFIIFVGLVVLIAIWQLLQRTRIGMIIRAGVQDSEMVEALGINVQRVFTFVFSLGVGLAALGGVLAAPSIGLSTAMGARLLLLALIALAIGGLTSFPGAAAGAVLVGLMQQFIIKYGQIGINIPFMEEPFKPSPPLVPASTVLLMVIILLVLPNGLFGRSE